MKKRLFCLIMAVIMLTIATLPVFAVQPRWSYTSSVNFTIYFDGEEGSIEGSVLGHTDVTKIEGTITLYYKNFLGFWSKTGDKWNVSTVSNYLIINQVFTATSGKQYKAELDVDVYSGSNSENITDDATGTCP